MISRRAQFRLLLLAAILLTFGRTLTNDFVDWDDSSLIFLNPNISHPTWAGLAAHWNPHDASNHNMYNPLVYTTWWALAHAAQLQNADLLGATLNPYIFHAANLLVHWLTACVVLEILCRLGVSDWPALGGTLVFALHPLQTEAVAWTTAMKDLLSGSLAMLTIWLYLLAMQSEGRKRWIKYAGATALFATALLAKPSTVVLPAIVAVIDLVLCRRAWRGVAARVGPWLALSAGATWLAATVQTDVWHIPRPPLWARPLIALDSLAFYLGKLFLPIHLSLDYGRNPTALLTNPALHHALYWTWIFPVAAALILWKSRQRELIAGGLIFVLGVLPVLGLTRFVFQYYSTVADRYVYVSMLGVALAVAWFLGKFHSRTVVAAFCALLAVLSALSFVQAGVWKDSDALYEHDLSLNPAQADHRLVLARYKEKLSLASYRRAELARQTGNMADARGLAEDGAKYMRQAIDYLRAAIQLDPLNPDSYDELSGDLIRVGKLDQAIAVTQQWMAIEPQIDSDRRRKPGMLQAALGALYLKSGQYPEAIAQLQASLQVLPDAEAERELQQAEKMLAASRAASRPS